MVQLAILGPGAVGAFIAATVARDDSPVTLIGREPTISQIGQKGIHVESPRFGPFDARVDAVRRLEEESEVLVVATKAPQLDSALERILVEPGVVVPLLNGIDHVARLRERFSCPVIPATINVQTYKEDPTTVMHRLDLARVNVAAPGHMGLERTLLRAGIDVGQHVEEETLLWRKLTRLSAIALATTANGVPLGDVRDDAYAVAAEAAAVARAQGADVETDTIIEELRALGDESSSSLRIDVEAGVNDTELEAISGPIVRGGAAHGLKCPNIERLVATIRGRIEASASR